MANPEQLRIFIEGAGVWNRWRQNNPGIYIDLSEAVLRYIVANGANLSEVNLKDAHLGGAYLENANLVGADLSSANLSNAHLSGAKLNDAYLTYAILSEADLSRTDLIGAGLAFANVSKANLDKVKLSGAFLNGTNFGDCDLSTVQGLESIIHGGPSIISIDTIYRSQGKIPERFLRGCGVPEDFITYVHSLTVQPINFYSCFISYSHKDEEFARRLYSRMRDAKLRVWFAPEEMKGGEKLHEQIFNAIHVHDKLLLVLSEHSLQSEWVMTEIRRARKAEREENRRKLFPIKLVDINAIQQWECFDADSGKDMAVEMREYFIPDFSNWKDHDSFEKAFDRLLRDLRAEDKQTAEGQS